MGRSDGGQFELLTAGLAFIGGCLSAELATILSKAIISTTVAFELGIFFKTLGLSLLLERQGFQFCWNIGIAILFDRRDCTIELN